MSYATLSVRRREVTPAAADRVAALTEALRAMAISDPMSADDAALGTTLSLLNRASRWVAQEIEDRMETEAAA